MLATEGATLGSRGPQAGFAGATRQAASRMARARWGWTVAGLLLWLAGPPAGAQPAEYRGAEIRARVVDAETQAPLEGVYVVARWDLHHWLSRGRTPLHAAEAVTDVRGEFYLPPWGPKPRPAFTELWGGDPRLLFFKPGYEVLARPNPTAPDPSPVRVSIRHGRTIELKPFRGTREVWVELLNVVQSYLAWGEIVAEFPYRLNDYWKYFPRTVLAVLEERQQLPQSLRHRVADLDRWEVSEDEVRAAAERSGGLP